jgi:hypothetical protein
MEVRGKVNVEVGSRYSVELTRGQRGGYGWVVKVRGDDVGDVLNKITILNDQLKAVYGNNTKGEE